MKQKRLRIGDLLIKNKLITEGQLEIALSEQHQSGKKLGQIAVSLGFVSEERLLRIISQQLNVTYIDLNQYRFEKNAVTLMSELHAKRLRAVPINFIDDKVLVAMEDPTDLLATDEIKRLLVRPIEPVLVRERDLDRFFEVAYRRTDEISSLANELQIQLGETDGLELELGGMSVEESEAPVVRLLQSIFEDAVRAKASDIHIEPDESIIRIRQRIDGVLQEYIVKEKSIAAALVMRLKIMAGMNISEKRLPQDGRFNIVVQGKNLDIRISSLPIQWGESIVMRLLDHSAGIMPLMHLGMPDNIRQRYETLIKKPHGMVLVTGPTGSGKTTTLYATLNLLNKEEAKIITVEDPVEYRLPRVNQVQVNHKIDLSFARVLRASLRQDPDIVLIGEMRDSETVKIGLRAAMTGHLVLSTLHTNDSISTALRLIDMGAEPYLVGSSLLAIVAQRLVRKVCDACAEPYHVTEKEKAYIESVMSESEYADFSCRQGVGCNACHYTGYLGRFGVYELLMMDDNLIRALQTGRHDHFIENAKAQKGYEPLSLAALRFALSGETSLAEALRVSIDYGMGVR